MAYLFQSCVVFTTRSEVPLLAGWGGGMCVRTLCASQGPLCTLNTVWSASENILMRYSYSATNYNNQSAFFLC